MSYPGVDPAPAAGATVSLQGLAGFENYTIFVPGNDSSKKYLMHQITYLPPAVLNGGAAAAGTGVTGAAGTGVAGTGVTGAADGIPNGRILPFQLPGWFNSLAKAYSASRGDQLNPSTQEDYGTFITPQLSSSDLSVNSDGNSEVTANSAIMRGAASIYAFYRYLTRYRQYAQVVIMTKLMIADNVGDFIFPGNLCRILGHDAEGEEEVIFDFYVTNIVHSIDCQGSEAHTEISGAYARPYGGFPGMAGNGIANPLYATNLPEVSTSPTEDL